MRIIKKSALRAYAMQFAAARSWMSAWMVVAEAAQWRSIADVRCTYRSADRAAGASGKPLMIFDVGNRFRLIVAIHYNTQRIYIRDFMTHEAYNSQKWKNRH